MKTLVITNEPFAEMLLGKNSSLAYILAAIEFGDVYVWNFAKNFCVKLTTEQAEVLTKEFKRLNLQIRNFLLEVRNVRVGDLIKESPAAFPEIAKDDLIIQRLEPMKAPFPPLGNRKVDDVLRELQQKFPNKFFNCPIGLHDKELREFVDISTPTAEFKLDEKSLMQALESMGDEYSKIYQNGKRKVVIKPKDLAQSLGVFAVDLSHKEDIKELCKKHGEEFYRGTILAQPFLEGVRQGDVRMTIFKNSSGDFECGGYAFRKSLRSIQDDNFTTGYVVGGSTPRPLSDLSADEQKNLLSKSAKILQILNGKLREKYRNSVELGADFLLVGNGRDVFLGEINHHCPGLIPVVEAMGDESEYKGGLGLVRGVVVGLLGIMRES